VEFKGRSIDSHEFSIPFKEVSGTDDSNEIMLVKSGAGRLYYRLGINYALRAEKISARDFGFSLSRKYEHVDDPSDVTYDDSTVVSTIDSTTETPITTSTTTSTSTTTTHQVVKIKAGKRVKVTVTVTSTAPRYHVALQDKLPSGFEVINTALKGTQSSSSDSSSNTSISKNTSSRYDTYFWKRDWFDHVNLRTERVEVFARYFAPGTVTYSYTARATGIGTFVAPPATAEEMYTPEVCGNSSSTSVIIS